MNANTKLERVRDLARSKMLALQPMAGEEMNLPQNDPHRDGFVAGERALATQIMALLDDRGADNMSPDEGVSATEEEMILSLGQT